MDRSGPPRGDKTPLCNFINNCREYKETKQCKYRHDLCNKQKNCQFGGKCRFYHPQLQQNVSNFRGPSKPEYSASNICRFGVSCKFKQTCKFTHQNNERGASTGAGPATYPTQRNTSKSPRPIQECRFGKNCKNLAQGTCRFNHSNQNQTESMVAPLSNKFQMQETKKQVEQNYNVEIKINAQLQEYEQKKMCQKFAQGQCKGQCQLLHQFVSDNSIQRSFFKAFEFEEIGNAQLVCCSFNFLGNRIFSVSLGRTMIFYELDHQFQAMKSISMNQLQAEDVITSIYEVNQGTQNYSKLLFTTKNNRLHLLDPLLGIMDSKNHALGQKLSFVSNFTDQKLLFSHGIQGKMSIDRRNLPQPDLIANMISVEGNPKVITVVNQMDLFGSSFVAMGTRDGFIVLINNTLNKKDFKIGDGSIDAICCASYWEKPFLFCLHSTMQQSEIIAVNLLDLSSQVVLVVKNNKISKLCCNHNYLFLGVDELGILVYFLPQFPKPKARIPFGGKFEQVACDIDGNLIVLCKDQGNSSLSIYRVRK